MCSQALRSPAGLLALRRPWQLAGSFTSLPDPPALCPGRLISFLGGPLPLDTSFPLCSPELLSLPPSLFLALITTEHLIAQVQLHKTTDTPDSESSAGVGCPCDQPCAGRRGERERTSSQLPVPHECLSCPRCPSGFGSPHQCSLRGETVRAGHCQADRRAQVPVAAQAQS